VIFPLDQCAFLRTRFRVWQNPALWQYAVNDGRGKSFLNWTKQVADPVDPAQQECDRHQWPEACTQDPNTRDSPPETGPAARARRSHIRVG
jgi:hypothetical protein